MHRRFQSLKSFVCLLLGDSLRRYSPGLPPQEIVHGPQRIGGHFRFSGGRDGILDGLHGVLAFITVFTTALALALGLALALAFAFGNGGSTMGHGAA